VSVIVIYYLYLTGAGKTYTMLGTDDEPGIMARGLNDLFVEMERTRDANQIAKIVKNFKIAKFNFFFKNQKILYMYL
jgi:hypothetical protein